MKKIVALVLCVLMVLSFAACNTEPEYIYVTKPPKTETTDAPVATATTAPGEDIEPDILKLEISSDSCKNGVKDGVSLVNIGTGKTFVDTPYGNGVHFSGGKCDYKLSLVDYYDFLEEEMTLELFVKFDELPSSGYWGVVDNCEAGGFGIELHSTGIIKWNMYLDGKYYTYDIDIDLDTWYHFVFTWDGNEVITYVDGEAVEVYDSNFGMFGFTASDGAKYLCIGACCNNGDGGQGFKGTIVACNMYTSCMSDTQVAANYEALTNIPD